MLPGKQKVLRIHEARFHEALSLLRTPARIRAVDQTALVVSTIYAHFETVETVETLKS